MTEGDVLGEVVVAAAAEGAERQGEEGEADASLDDGTDDDYNLKGALFERYTSDAAGAEDVLLDQNFVEDMNFSSSYVSHKAKRVLQRAIWNETSFLNNMQSINVMDYSLLVGVDSKKRELVCGIIDYLRQYT
ncbi:putative 1-phosphatidylinositol-3-phosphate 5-kinase fab1d [Lathyrus oleraceus]|uniref:1-phosphatidylinositol-3-phosphate 5-kinase fab1d n=1 Tax=Pisum sativum TaxID=3888 RepID=A0A9D4VWD6_PEA|nr:putative 1-phosphatidylinositol-3-phosphate 5-kinase fab1d [Pisum sativum]